MNAQENKKNIETKKEYKEMAKNIANAASSLIMYPAGHPIVEKQLLNLHSKLADILTNDKLINIHRGEGTLVINNAEISTNEPSIKKFDKHFNNFKITDLEISPNLTVKELRDFLEIFAHSEESSKIYQNLEEACQKNQIKNIKPLQAAYIRVPKDVKDKLGGKAVGELKINQEEMNRLIDYLKGEISLAHPKETKIYKKIFQNTGLLSSLIEKIIYEKNSEDQKKKLIIVALNQVGDYVVKEATNESKRKESIKIISELEKNLSNSEPLIALTSGDGGLKNEINRTIEKIKSLVKNQALIAEYSNYKNKLKAVEKKIQIISPDLLETENEKADFNNKQSELQKFLEEVKNFLDKIIRFKSLTETDLKKIEYIIEKIKSYL
jgi:hypothetical protein